MTPEETLRQALLEDKFPEFESDEKPIIPIADPLKYNRMTAVSAWMGNLTGQDISPEDIGWQAEKDALAQSFFKMPDAKDVSDETVHDLIRSHIQTSDNATNIALNSALTGRPLAQTLNEIQALAGVSKTRGIRDRYVSAASSLYSDIAAKRNEYSDVINKVYGSLGEMLKKTDTDIGMTDAFNDAAERLMGVPAEDRRLVIEAIAATGNATAEERSSYLSKVEWRVNRMAETLGAASVSNLSNALESVLDLAAFGSGLADPRDVAGAAPEGNKSRELSLLAQQIRTAANEKLDPIKSNSWIGKQGLALADMATQSGVALVNPLAGFAVNLAYFNNTMGADAMTQNPGLTVEQADKITAIGAPVNAAIETITALIPFGKVKLPFVQKWLMAETASVGGVLRKFGVRAGFGTAAEIGEEIGQAYVPLKIQELMRAMGQDMPAVDWERNMPKFADIAAEVWAPALVFSIVGAGAASINDINNGRSLASDLDLLIARGIAPETAAKIKEASDLGDYNKVDSLFREEFVSETKASKPDIQAATERLKARFRDQSSIDVLQDATSPEYTAKVIRTATGWQVQTGDGNVITTETKEAADQIYSKIRQVGNQKEAEVMAEILDGFYSGGMGKGAQVEMTGETTMAQEIKAGEGRVFAERRDASGGLISQRQFGPQALETVRAEAEAAGIQTDTRGIFARINGSNEVFPQQVGDTAKGIWRILSLFESRKNATPQVATLLHEDIESKFTLGLINKSWTVGDIQKAFAALLPAFANITAPIVQTDEQIAKMSKSAQEAYYAKQSEFNWINNVRNIVDGKFDAATLRETFSEMYVRDRFALDRKGLPTGLPAGSISRGIEASIMGATTQEEAGIYKRFRAMFKAFSAHFKAVFKTVQTMVTARKEGKIGEDWDSFVNKVLGIDEVKQMESQTVDEVKAMLGIDEEVQAVIDAGNMAFSISPITSAEDVAYNESIRVEPTSMMARIANRDGVGVRDNILYRKDRAYRFIGAEGLADLRETGLVRARQNTKQAYEGAVFMSGKSSGRYADTHMIELIPDNTWTGDKYITPPNNLAINDIPHRIYERNADGSYSVIEDTIGDQALLDAENMAFSISAATNLAESKRNDPLMQRKIKKWKKSREEMGKALEEADDDFFNVFWPELMKAAGQRLKPSLRNINEAARRSVDDILGWLKENPKYLNYYADDWNTTRNILDITFPNFTDDDFVGFRLFTGLTSPATPLRGNLADAMQVMNLWQSEKSFGKLQLERSEKGNRKVKDGNPFKLQSNTGANKIFTLKVIEGLFGKLGNWEAVNSYLNEGITSKELNAFNKEMGYAGGVSDIGDIRRVVNEATGQDKLIPRMFIFGPKVGAYTLNATGDSRFTTTDIWESRFIRSYFPQMFENGTGLPTNGMEHEIFQNFASAFKRTIEVKMGQDFEPSALQAVRWFYMIFKSREAGYKYGSTSGTISDYAQLAAKQYLGIDFDDNRGGGRGDAGNGSRDARAESSGANVAGPTFSISPAQDAEYLNLAKDPEKNRTLLQRMVDAAAKAAGYLSPKVYHGTQAIFNVFDELKIGSANGRSEGSGFYFTTDQGIAKGYQRNGGNIISAYLNVKKPLDYNQKPFSTLQIKKLLKAVALTEAKDSFDGNWKDGFLANYGDTYSKSIDSIVAEAATYFTNEESALDQIGSIIGSGVDPSTVNTALTSSFGYDAFFSSGFSGEGNKGGDIYVVMRSNQIKSADPVTRDDAGNIIPLSQRFNEATPDIRFSISPVRNLNELSDQVEKQFAENPVGALEVKSRMIRQFAKISDKWSNERWTPQGNKIRPISEKRTVKSLDKEQAMRQAQREVELVNEGIDKLTPNTLMAYSEGVGVIQDDPLVARMLNDNGKLMSKSTAAREGRNIKDQYDDAGWIPPQWYAKAGGIMPDVMANNLGFDTASEMWAALDSSIKSHRNAKEDYAKAEAAVKAVEKAAFEQAKTEAQAWRDETDAMQKEDWSPKESLVRDLITLEAIRAVFPQEIRDKIGGFVALARKASEAARLKVLQKQLERGQVLLEKHLKDQYNVSLLKMLDKAAPVGKPGEIKKSKFIVTVQDELDAISEIVGMDSDDVTESITTNEAAIISAQTPEAADAALTRLNLLELFGGILDLKRTSSQEMEVAHEYLAKLMQQGREARKIIDEARSAKVKEMVATAKADAFKGQTGPETTQAARAKAAKESGMAMLKKFFSELSGFDAVLRDAFGPQSETARSFSERFTLNSNDFEDVQNERRTRFRDFARELYQTKFGAKINQKLIKLERIENNSGVTYLKNREVKSHKFTEADAAKIVADPKAFGFTDKDAAAISEEIQAIQNSGGRRKVFTYDQIISNGERVEIPLSQMDAVYISMALRQPGILEQQERHGYDQQTVDELDKYLTDEAKAWRRWMQTEYDAEYQRANEVYMRMFNARMPMIMFYAPLLKNHQGQQAILDPLNTGISSNSANPGSIKTRKGRTSSLRIESALTVFWAHFNQMEYWIANAEYLRDVQAVLLNPEVRESIVASHGEDGMATISAWIQLQMSRGVGKAAMATAGNKMFRNVKTGLTMKALALSYTTALKTLPSVFYSLGEIHMSKWPAALVSGMTHWNRLWKTNIIQRRLDIGGMPELRDLGSSAMPMSWMNQLIKYGSAPAMYADGVFTTFSAAMAYGVNYDEAIRQGASEDLAHKHAEERTALIVSRTAQPENWTQKSLLENDVGAFGSMFTLFMSDPRQKMALTGAALNQFRKGNVTGEEAARKFLAYWVIPGIMFQLANAIGRSLFKGDDDEWEVVDFATAALVGQFQGLVLLGSGVEMIFSAAIAAAAEKITGEEVKRKPFWNSSKNPLDQAAQDLIKSAENLNDTNKDVFEKTWEVIKSVGLLTTWLNPAGAVPATVERVIKDTTNLFYGAEDQ